MSDTQPRTATPAAPSHTPAPSSPPGSAAAAVPSETRQVRVEDKVTLHARVDGREGAWVLLVHPLGADHTVWDPTAAHLARNHRVLRLDLRGHGQSDAPVGAYSMLRLADDVCAVMDAFEVPQAHFVGLSLGGMVGQTFAVRYPDRLHSLVLADTACRTPLQAHPMWHERIGSVEAHGMAGIVDATLQRWFTAPFRTDHADTVDRIRAMLLATPVRGYVGACLAILAFDQREALPRIHCPTLVLVGEDDAGCPVAEARAIADAIPGSQFEVLPQAAHLAPVEQSGRFHAVLDAFLCRAACGSQCDTP